MSGAYEKHIRTAHGGLDSFLVSTVQYINIEPGVLHNSDASGRQDSNYESVLGPAGLQSEELCRDIL